MNLYICCIVQVLVAENIYLFINDSVSLNAYDYFSGINLNITSDSPQAKISTSPVLTMLQEIPYEDQITQSDIDFQLLSVFEFGNNFYIADNKGSIIYLYKFNITSQTLTFVNQLNLNETIQETYTWSNKNSYYLLVITREEYNNLYLIKFGENLTTLKFDFWDLRYVNYLRSSEVLLGSYIPFIGNLYNQSIFYLYDFADPINPVLQFVYTNDSFSNSVDMTLNFNADNTIDFFITYQSSDILKLSYDLDSQILSLEKLLKLSTTFTDISTSFAQNSTSSLRQYQIIVGSSPGIFSLDPDDLHIRFSVKGENNYALTSSFVFNNLYLSIQEDLKLFFIEDTSSERIVANIIDVKDVIKDFYKSKWHIGQWPDGNFIIVVSNPDNLVVYNLTLSLPTITLTMGNTDKNYIATVTDGTKSIEFNVTALLDLNSVYYLNNFRKPNTINPSLEVLFDGFTSKQSLIPKDILSGRNLSYEFDLSLFDNTTFSLTHGSFDKLQLMGSIQLNFSYNKILICGQSLFFIQNTAILEYSVNNFSDLKLVNKYEVDTVTSTTVLNNEQLIFSYINQSENYIWINNDYKIKTNITCKFLTAATTFILCASDLHINVYNLTSSLEYELISCLVQENKIVQIVILYVSQYSLIVILDVQNTLLYIFLDYINISQISYIFNIKKIYMIDSSLNTLFLQSEFELLVYDYENNLKSFPLPYKFYELTCNENFAYIYEKTSSNLTIIDSYRNIINSVYLEITLDPNCVFKGAGFFNQTSWVLQVCDETDLKIFTSDCPIYGSSTFCETLLPFQVEITNYKNLSQGSYQNQFAVIGKNDYSSLSYNVNLNLIVYGQAVVGKDNPFSDFYNIQYNYQIELDLLDVFTGCNMDFSLEVKSEKNEEVDSYNPYELIKRFESTPYYKNNFNILGLTSIRCKQFLVFSDENLFFNVLNTSSGQSINVVNVKKYNSNFVNCPIVNSLFDNDPEAFLALVCNLNQSQFEKYYFGTMNKINTNPIYGLVIIKFHLSKLEIMSMQIYPLNITPSFMNLVYEGSLKVSILIISDIYEHNESDYLNNKLEIREFELTNDELLPISFVSMDFLSLSLDRFYVTAVSGIYKDLLYLIVIDKYFGARIFMIDNLEVTKLNSIKNINNDYFTSIGLTYRLLSLITSTAKILVYKWDLKDNISYYSTRYPFTIGSTSIYSIPSKVTYETFFYNQFLVFTVVYNAKTYFRIIDTTTKYSSSLVRDVEYNNTRNSFFDYHMEFTNSSTSYYINNSNELHKVVLKIPKLIKKQLSKHQYDKMTHEYKTNEFSVEIISANGNNNCSANATCKISPYSSSKNSDASSDSWLLFVLSGAVLFVLIITIIIVYKCVFRKKKKLENAESKIEMAINTSFRDIN